MLAYSAPPGYARKQPVGRPKLCPWLGIIDQILEEDQSQPKKQRHTAKRIWERLKAEHSFGGGYTIVKDYVREALLRESQQQASQSAAPRVRTRWFTQLSCCDPRPAG